ncbi:DoxX family protein [Pontibacter sp. BT731]|uniref:DoxX family protein n=1 Tax=Pontibacter coccineus TaxID=3063328 RepID=UPI0026E2C5C9|nr:DoxX family protein [Pontibacter sp. BT731]MDO6391222.1 DoxX family protein [Pontibacter sp. BT731]
MNLTQDMHRIEHWADTHHPVWVDFVRMALGIFLFVKGVMFIQDTQALQSIMSNSQFQWVSLGMAHYVAFVHLVGGLLIAMGLVTRIAILFQIPILLGAVFFINPQHGFYSENTELWSSVIVLILLIVFLILGSGRLSVDNLISRPERDILY